MNLRYVVLRRGNLPTAGSGESINVSVSGLLFHGETKTQPGDSVLAVMDWPARGPHAEALTLVVTGLVLRNRKSQTAVSLTTSRLLPASDIAQRFGHYFVPHDELPPSTTGSVNPPTLEEDEDPQCTEDEVPQRAEDEDPQSVDAKARLYSIIC